MKRLSAADCLRVALESLAPEPNIRALALRNGISRPTVYAWRRRLLGSAEIVFASRTLEERLQSAEREIKWLRNRRDELEAALTRAGRRLPPISESPPHGEFDDEED